MKQERSKLRYFMPAVLAFALTVIGFVLSSRDPVTRSTYQKIELGMTMKQVQTLIGHFGKNHMSIREALRDLTYQGEMVEDGEGSDEELEKMTWWRGRTGLIAVQMTGDDHVRYKMFTEIESPEFGLLRLLRGWLPW